MEDALAGKFRDIATYLPKYEADDVIEFIRLTAIGSHLRRTALGCLVIAVGCALSIDGFR